MGSALVFPLSENGVSLKIVGTPYDREIIDECIRTGRNPKLPRPFPSGISFYQFEDWKKAVPGSDFVIGGISSYGAEWFLSEVLKYIPEEIPVITVVKGLRVNEDGSLSTWPQYWERELSEAGVVQGHVHQPQIERLIVHAAAETLRRIGAAGAQRIHCQHPNTLFRS